MLLLPILISACAPATDPGSSRPSTIAEFVERLERDLEAHEWQSILAATDPTLYRTRVVDARTAEPVFIAQTLGIDSAPNSIQEGDTLEWADFDRIENAELAAAARETPPYVINGNLTLEDGALLRVTANATQVQGRFVLTATAE